MASQLKVDTLTGVTTAGSIDVTGEGNSTTTNLQQGLCKQWIKYNATGTPAIRDSFNTNSITDNATGTFTITLTAPSSDDEYCITGLNSTTCCTNQIISTNSTNSYKHRGQDSNGSNTDDPHMCAAVHGDLA
jgi:hypothetical protein